jgi:hypothetical protein
MTSLRARTMICLGAALAAAALLSACVVAPAPYPEGGAYVTVAPPAPQVEVIGTPPVPGYFWIGGYWGWVGGRHEWVGGHWEAPRPGYHYVPHAWVREGGGYRAYPGHWEPERR